MPKCILKPMKIRCRIYAPRNEVEIMEKGAKMEAKGDPKFIKMWKQWHAKTGAKNMWELVTKRSPAKCIVAPPPPSRYRAYSRNGGQVGGPTGRTLTAC